MRNEYKMEANQLLVISGLTWNKTYLQEASVFINPTTKIVSGQFHLKDEFIYSSIHTLSETDISASEGPGDPFVDFKLVATLPLDSTIPPQCNNLSLSLESSGQDIRWGHSP